MRTKFPNTSILNIITQSNGDSETIIFFHIKNVPDYIENDLYWFDNKGKNGRANFIWENLSLKQWLAIGKDNDILNQLNNILDNSTININSTEIKFNIPSYKFMSFDEQHLKSRNDIKFDSYTLCDISIIPRSLLNKENLDVLSGLTLKNDNIKPLFPLGLYEKNFIYNHLKQKTFGLVEYRQAYLTFRGVRSTSIKGQGSSEIIGFYQENFSNSKDYFATIENETSFELGRNKIEKENGVFSIELSEPTSKGQVIIKDTNEEIKKIDFTLIQNIKFDTNIVNKSFKDIYGREFGITSKKENSITNLNAIYWEKDLFNSEIEAYTKLSDIFRTVFEYLGENILIADPYFIGQFKLNETTKEYELSQCQKAFINAFTHYSLEFEMKNLTILGSNSRANSQADSNDDDNKSKTELRFENYEKFFRNYILSNKLKSFLSNITFKNSTTKFHNRYWFSVKNEDGIIKLEKCLIVTNSLGNIEEIDIVPCADEEQFNLITTRFLLFNNNSSKELEIK